MNDNYSVNQDVNHQVFNTAEVIQYKPAGNFKRIAAFLIDGAILSVISGLFQNLIISTMLNNVLQQYVTNLFFTFVIWPLFYWVYLTLEFGATPGKKMLGLKIVNADHSLNLSLSTLLVRELVGRFVSGITIGLGYIWGLAIDREKRTFHDMIGKTRVVEFR